MAMTTSLTRSRRAEGLHPSHPNTRHPPQQLVANARAANNNQNFVANLQRTKRSLDTSAREYDPLVVKKARFTTGIAVEIPSRSSFQSRVAREANDAKKAPPPPPPPIASQEQTTPAAVAGRNGDLTPSRAPASIPTVAKAGSTRGTQPQQQHPAPTRHKEKVGKHELNKLQANLADTKSQGRKLRSQEATRFKSELSAYFPDYDEVIGNEPKEQHILGLDTPIVIDNVPKPSSSDRLSRSPQPQLHGISTRSYSDSLFTDLWDSQRIDFSFLTSQNKNKSLADPLPDSLFEPAHKKSERLERSIRNSEKGRAQHEKDQIIRLLDCLQGPDWLRVMGVSGITESRKKTFEPARDHFIKGCQAILEKFRTWAAEEKRRKLEKDRAIAEAEAEAKREAAREEEAADDEEDDDDGEDIEMNEDEDPTKMEIPDSDEEMEDVDQIPDAKDADPPDDSDVDASIAKQLREEALAAAKTKSRRGRRTVTPALPPSPPPPRKPEAQKEFTTFFQKNPHLRDTALNKSRRKGRVVWAWGHPVPELDEAEFQLPEEFLTEDTLKSRARGKRRSKRKHAS